MPRTLHPALQAGAATALALALTSTTVLPATAMPVVPEAPAAPTTTADPAVQSGQAASQVTGEKEQSIAIGGIDPQALTEPEQVESTPSEPTEPSAPSATTTPSADATPQANADKESSGFALTSLTAPAASAVPVTSAAPTTPAAPAAPTTEAAEAEPESAGQPSDVVVRELQKKAEASTATIDAPAAAEAPELAPTVLEEAAADDGVDAASIAALTQPIETIDFIVAGVTWDIADAGNVTDVSLRVREDSNWTDWSTMEIHDGDEKPGADRVGTEPLVSSGADAIQVRIETVDGEVPSGLELDLIDPGTAETDGKLEPASAASPALEQIGQQTGANVAEPAEAKQAFAASTPAATSTSTSASTAAFVPAIQNQQGLITGTAQATTVAANADSLLKPAIITRAQWGANESVVKDYGTPAKDLKAMYVHHTAGSNNYTAAGAYAQIRGIFTYHAVNLAWGDIGYQFLVDKYGNIFQGRRGSIDKPVQGAQAGGFNTDTIGVSAMGNYDVAAAPTVMVNAIEKVLAWQAYRYDVDPTANVTLTQRGNAGTARWSDGKQVSVPTILGHKVTNMTACPGRYLDAKLPSIRKDVDALVNAAESRDGAVTPTPALKRPTLPSNPYKLAAPGFDTTLDWNPVAGTDHYQIMYRAVPHGGGNISGQKWLAGRTTKSTTIVVGAEPGETAQYAVRAVRNGVPSPQTYLGQHTGPVSWDHPGVHTAAMTKVSDGYGVGGYGIRTNGRGAAVRIENASAADRVVVTANVSSGTADFEVTRDGKYAGMMRISGPGLTVCGLNLPAGSNVRLELKNTATTTLTNIALTRSGHTQDIFLQPTRCEVSFTDVVAGSNYFTAVDWMQKKNITTGYANRTFGVRRNISRGESVAFVHRYLAPSFSPKNSAPFKDVARGHTFFLPISWAKSKGIAKGYSNGTFGVGQDVTRGEFASFLYRAAAPKFSVPKAKSFKDVAAGSTHHAAISWMKSTGLSNGYANGNYKPTQPITRGEVALILHRFDQQR